jgi:DNA-binding MltR family transcriptional regulator
MTWAILEDLRESHTKAIIEILTGSERALAVVGGALLDESVRRTLEARLLEDQETVTNLLGPDGPLGAFKPKIDVLYLLGGLDQPTWSTLKALATIRNFFAHDLTASFDSSDAKFLRAMTRLTLHEGRTHYPHHLCGGDSKVDIEKTDTNQTRFLVNLKLALVMLMRDRMSHHAHTNTALTHDELKSKFPHLNN